VGFGGSSLSGQSQSLGEKAFPRGIALQVERSGSQTGSSGQALAQQRPFPPPFPLWWGKKVNWLRPAFTPRRISLR